MSPCALNLPHSTHLFKLLHIELLAAVPLALLLLLEAVKIHLPLGEEADDLQRVVDLGMPPELVADVGVTQALHLERELLMGVEDAPVQRQGR